MGRDTAISWAHDTFNVVWGCVEVSEACARCYAREFSKRMGLDLWGKDKPRRQMSDKYWAAPLAWNERARKTGERRRVFCSSMADVFEDHPDVAKARGRLWPLIERTPYLDWLLLTKRIELAASMAPSAWSGGWPANVWPGATTENQRRYDERIAHLTAIPSERRWLSVEPMVGPLKLGAWAEDVAWVIVGGESGNGARLMEPEWVRALLAECRARGVAFHFKQKGRALAHNLGCRDREGKDRAEWPAEFQVQEFPA